MTYYQESLLEEAVDMWERGFVIPTCLALKLASEGMDVPALEEIYYKDIN